MFRYPLVGADATARKFRELERGQAQLVDALGMSGGGSAFSVKQSSARNVSFSSGSGTITVGGPTVSVETGFKGLVIVQGVFTVETMMGSPWATVTVKCGSEMSSNYFDGTAGIQANVVVPFRGDGDAQSLSTSIGFVNVSGSFSGTCFVRTIKIPL